MGFRILGWILIYEMEDFECLFIDVKERLETFLGGFCLSIEKKKGKKGGIFLIFSESLCQGWGLLSEAAGSSVLSAFLISETCYFQIPCP